MDDLLSLPAAQKLLKIPGTRGKRLKTILLGKERALKTQLIERIPSKSGGRTLWRVRWSVLNAVLPGCLEETEAYEHRLEAVRRRLGDELKHEVAKQVAKEVATERDELLRREIELEERAAEFEARERQSSIRRSSIRFSSEGASTSSTGAGAPSSQRLKR